MEQFNLPFYEEESIDEEDPFYTLTVQGYNPKEYNNGNQINCISKSGNVISYYPTTGTIVVNGKTYKDKITYRGKNVEFYISQLEK